jgi:hypothetical protein
VPHELLSPVASSGPNGCLVEDRGEPVDIVGEAAEEEPVNAVAESAEEAGAGRTAVDHDRSGPHRLDSGAEGTPDRPDVVGGRRFDGTDRPNRFVGDDDAASRGAIEVGAELSSGDGRCRARA